MQRVAVVGAGAAGLCAARFLSQHPFLFETVVFEQSGRVGGTWIYTEETKFNQYDVPIHSSMYISLSTNLPKEVMAFPGFPFESSLQSFIGHADVASYLQKFSDKYQLEKYIKFHTRVECVKPVKQNGEVKWDFTFRDVRKSKDEQCEKLVFDAVMVCNGHYSIPIIPDIPGLPSFTGKVIHSHTYRHREEFQGQKLVVLGAGSSGVDIALDVASVAETVNLSHWRKPLISKLPENMKQAGSIQEIDKDFIKFSDGTKEVADSIILCTGYSFDFSFLHPDCELEVNESRVTPLYKHIIHTKYPSLSMIGICSTICPFPMFSCQVQFAISALTGSMQLPSKEYMDRDIERDYQRRLSEGLPHRHAHTMGPRQWDYNDDICSLGGIDVIPRVVRTLYDAVHDERTWNVTLYKKSNYNLIDDITFEKVEAKFI